jgi:hypothetical protein
MKLTFWLTFVVLQVSYILSERKFEL